MRKDVREMLAAIDDLYLYLAIGYGGMCLIAFTILGVSDWLGADGLMWAMPLGGLPWVPWVRCSVRVHRLTAIVRRNNGSASPPAFMQERGE